MKAIFPAAPLAALLAGAFAGHAGSVPAAEVERLHHQNPSSNCQGALHVFAEVLRARPLGVGNEGTAPVFVTCSYSSQEQNAIRRLSTYWTNTTAADITVNCTGVFGAQRFGSVIYSPKSISIAPGNTENLFWTNLDNGGNPLFEPANVSCEMPAGTVMLDSYLYFNEEIGA